MKLLITGDLVVSSAYDASTQFGSEIVDFFNGANINMINLEAPVTNSESKILKTGPNLKSHEESTLQALNKLKISVASLANNHILDYGAQGVSDTIQFCQKHGIQTVGAGDHLEEASRTLFLDTEIGIIAILNFAENEWASATATSAGAHPMDIIDNSRKIQEAQDKADYVIVIVHGGHEYYNLPSPRMQKQYRFYADQGADLVVGHHTHSISGYEIYEEVPIFYSLGNFLFPKKSSRPTDWYTGLILEIDIVNGHIKTQLHPVRQEIISHKIYLLLGDKKDKI